jgi:hypothetical protein
LWDRSVITSALASGMPRTQAKLESSPRARKGSMLAPQGSMLESVDRPDLKSVDL